MQLLNMAAYRMITIIQQLFLRFIHNLQVDIQLYTKHCMYSLGDAQQRCKSLLSRKNEPPLDKGKYIIK